MVDKEDCYRCGSKANKMRYIPRDFRREREMA